MTDNIVQQTQESLNRKTKEAAGIVLSPRRKVCHRSVADACQRFSCSTASSAHRLLL